MGIDIGAPQSSRGVMLLVGSLLLILIWIFATSLGTVLLGAIVLVVVGYLLLVSGGRLHDWLRHGKPLFRRRARRKDRQARSNSGGDGSDSGGKN